MKKFVKITAIVLLFFLAVLIAIPFFLEAKIDSIVQNYAEKNLNADFSFDDISLSLVSSFPKAEVSVDNLRITTRAPFEGETLATAKMISFEMPISALFNSSEEALSVNEIIADELLLTIKTNTLGSVNYDILKVDDAVNAEKRGNSSGFKFDVEHYEINNSAFTYIDETSKTVLYLTEINHSGNGMFSAEQSELETKTSAKISMAIDGTTYLSNTIVKLDALIGLDLEQQIYTFKENKGFLNALPLEFEGYVQLVENGQDIAISFKNPESSFRDFLAVIPEAYAKNIDDVATTGNFTVNGKIKGLLSDDTIPTLDINVRSDNASFKYPNLTKRVDNIMIDASVKNITGLSADTYIDINTLNFQIEQDVFRSEAHLKNLTENMQVSANLDGVLNLANITKAYPIALENQLSGILKGKLNTTFDMDAIETNAYERIKNEGSVSITDFVFSSEDIVNPIQINTADLSFKPGLVSLKRFSAQTGTSDLKATGTITNLLGFLLSDKTLQGNFKVDSKMFAISDFMVEDQTPEKESNKTSADEESLKIPAFLDCTFVANAESVIYDGLTLKNVSGELRVKDQNANLSQMKTDLFNGQIGISGNVSTKAATPTFDMTLAMQQFDISQSFEQLKMLKAIAPIAKVLQGKLNANIDVSGLLDENFSPDLMSISGKALAEILTSKVNANQSPLLTQLDNSLDFIDFDKFDLKDLKTNLSFENGQVAVSPFTIMYKDIPIRVSGSHSFSNTINYSAVLEVPATYLGSEVNRLIGQINESQAEHISIPITANIVGTFSTPKISTDLSSGVTKLTKQLVEIQKQKLLGQGKDKANELLGGLLGGATKTTEKDSSSKTSGEETLKTGVNSILKNLMGGSKKTKKAQDSTKT